MDKPSQILSINQIQTREQFEELFRTYYQELCSFVMTFLKDELAAEEVVQEVYFKLWLKREEITFSASPKSYLYAAVRNASLNVIKHIEIREGYKKQNEESRRAEENSTGDSMELMELEQKIALAVSELPEARQKIFVMSRHEGLKYIEIAEELGISIKTVEAQMGKALSYLKEKLRDYLPLWLWLFIFFE